MREWKKKNITYYSFPNYIISFTDVIQNGGDTVIAPMEICYFLYQTCQFEELKGLKLLYGPRYRKLIGCRLTSLSVRQQHNWQLRTGNRRNARPPRSKRSHRAALSGRDMSTPMLGMTQTFWLAACSHGYSTTGRGGNLSLTAQFTKSNF